MIDRLRDANPIFVWLIIMTMWAGVIALGVVFFPEIRWFEIHAVRAVIWIFT